LTPAERQEAVAGAIREMNQRYVFPETAKQVEAALRREQAAHAFDGAVDGPALAKQLTASLQAVTHDKHIRVRYSEQPVPVRQQADDTPTPEELAEWRKEEQFHNFGVQRVERLPGNIGYLDLRGFAPAALAGPTLAAAMTLLAHTDTLIVDLRKNGGGDPETVALVCSYLFDHRTHLNSLYFREGDRTEQFWTQEFVPGTRFGEAKPVYVLTSSSTFSGAEEFSYNLRTRKRATLVGETTGGGANPGDLRRLAEHFEMFVPSGRAINPVTGTNWEGTGVEPHVKVAADQALDVAQAMALKALIATEKDDQRRQQLQERLAEVQKTPASR
jgi:C-terminal processing protease CtpA/Prc